jgi:hypothetical protein
MSEGVSRAIDSAAPPLHSAAPVAVRGSGRSSVLSGLSPRSSSVRRHFAALSIRNQIAYPPGKDIAVPSPTEVDFTAPHPRERVAGCPAWRYRGRASLALKVPHRIRLGERCRHGRPGSACS